MTEYHDVMTGKCLQSLKKSHYHKITDLMRCVAPGWKPGSPHPAANGHASRRDGLAGQTVTGLDEHANQHASVVLSEDGNQLHLLASTRLENYLQRQRILELEQQLKASLREIDLLRQRSPHMPAGLDEIKRLSPRTSEIYWRLKSAIARQAGTI